MSLFALNSKLILLSAEINRRHKTERPELREEMSKKGIGWGVDCGLVKVDMRIKIQTNNKICSFYN